NATILLVGDHTEGYEIFNIAFVKRRGERHDSLQFNSIPCQISDIAGTVLKEYGVETDLPSLYDMPQIVGDGSVRPEQVRYVDFTPWKRCERLYVENDSYNSCRMVPEGDALIFENFIDGRKIEIGTVVSLFMSRLDGKGIWEAMLDYSQPYPCLRASSSALPDGDYRVNLYCYNKDDDGTLRRSLVNTVPDIRIRDGRATPIAPN
ncbi:MAG: hypothetical protein IJS15_14655, partial [Victivallales bacterium]|nr:hypothetical protein [Victivallales bacterium]